MNARLARVFLVSGCLCGATAVGAQPLTEFSKDQRTLLQAMVAAVDAAAHQPSTEIHWPTHVMRASDGSHYVAFSVAPPATMPLPIGPVQLYVRLASAPGTATTTLERSAIRDWLAGQRIDPRLLPGRGIVLGEMPPMGAAGNLERRPTVIAGSTDLQLMALERQREREREAARDKQRRAELEGRTAGLRELLPFEDVDAAALSTAADGTRQISRALTAGPGNYQMYVAWADPSASNPGATIRVLKRPLSLPPAGASELTMSSVIIADKVAARPTPLAPIEQARHPYSIGTTEITPARDAVFTRDEELAVAFQVINARASDAGKPDVVVAFRVIRLQETSEQPVASLNPQHYSAETMPPDFDLRLGHPLFVAVTAPLTSLARGSYRLKIEVHDRLAGSTRTADADFHIVGTPLSLLAEAPLLAPPFRREAALAPAVLQPVLQALTPSAPTPALRRALDHAAARRFIDLLIEEPVADSEQGVRVALTGLARLGVGDTTSAIQFQRAQLLGAPVAPARFLAGAARAIEGRDADAIAAWEEAAAAGAPKTMLAPFLLDAYLRRNDRKRAAAIVDATANAPNTPAWSRGTAAARIASGNYPAALSTLDRLLTEQPADADALWLWLHATYATLVSGPGANAASRDRFIARGQEYIDTKGPNADLVRDWLSAVRAK